MLPNLRCAGAGAVFFLGAALALSAAPPVVTSLDVRGLQIGKVNSLTFTGTDLLPNPRLLTTARLARQTLKNGASPNRITLEVELAPGAQPGFENWWLVTDHGVSARGIFATDSLGQKPFAAKVDALPVALHGTLAGSEVKEVTFHGKMGQEVICEMEAQRLESKVRPVLNLYGPGNKLVEFSLPMAELRGDTRLEAKLPADGEYRLQIHDLQYAAAAPGQFCLKIGQWSYADLAFPSTVQRGVTTEVELVGRTGETHTVRVSSTTEDPAVPAPWPEPANASGPQAPVLLSDLRELVEERNGTAPQALGALPVAVNGRISKSNETDAYELTVEPETEVDIAVAADTLGSPIDAELELRDAKGARLAINDDTPDGPDPRLTYKVPPGVTKLIAVVRDVNGHAGPRCIYRLSATRKGQENPAGFTLALTEDSHTLEPGLSNVFKVEAVRAGYDGPIDLVFDHLPDSVKISGQNVPAQATATLVTLSSDAPLPPLIIGLKGRGKDGEAAASVESIQLGRFQPWLAQSVALAGAAKSDVAFSVRWGAAVAEKKVPLGGRFVLPVTCTRPPGHDGPVRLTLLTSQGRKTGKVAAQNAALNLREEKAVLIEEDKNAQAAFNVIATAQAALAAAQKAVEANKDDTAAEALAGKVEEAQAAIEKTKAAADEAAQKAKNDVEVAVAVPAELPEIPHQIAFKAELLKRDRRTVEAVAYTPVQEIPVVNPLAVKPHAPAPIQLDPKAGATVEITGKVERLEGAVGDILLTMSDLPPGIAAPPAVTVKAGATDFKFTLKIPPTFKPGEYAGPKIFGTGKPFGPLQVRSRDNPVTLTILSPGKGSGTPVSSDTPKAAGETPVPGGTPIAAPPTKP
ncbi:hypothetical protein [Chthoniobacter flavus]|uniref:hypothetical protein n=1 Tax=Chthoniobacter flavus TaxID=191863 RepID=UPI001A9DA631|nr:hypothetical protein [Chthoniobacter flavus]